MTGIGFEHAIRPRAERGGPVLVVVRPGERVLRIGDLPPLSPEEADALVKSVRAGQRFIRNREADAARERGP